MEQRVSRSWLAPVLALICLLAQPVSLPSQCVVSNTFVTNFVATNVVAKTLTASGTCRSVANNNVLGCFPTTAPQYTVIVLASAFTAATNPSCSFVCTCGGIPGGITIDGSDGLPVELMDFGIESGAAEDAGEGVAGDLN